LTPAQQRDALRRLKEEMYVGPRLEVLQQERTDLDRKHAYAKQDRDREKTASETRAKAYADYDRLSRFTRNLDTGFEQLLDGVSALKAPKSAIEAELEKLKAYSSKFQHLVRKVQQVTEKVGSREVSLEQTLASISAKSKSLTQATRAIDELGATRSGAYDALRPGLLTHFQAMEADALNQLLMFQYYMVKAYEYRMLKPCTRANYRLDFLHDEMERLIEIVDKTEFGADAATKKEEFLPSTSIARMEAIYKAHLAAIVGDIKDALTKRGATYDGSLTFQLRSEQLDELNREGKVTVNLMEEGMISHLMENVRCSSIGIDEKDGIHVQADTRGQIIASFQFVHSGLSLLRERGKILAFRTLADLDKNSEESARGRSWHTTCTFKLGAVEVKNHEIAAEESSLLDGLLNEKHSGERENRARYASPAAWADITIYRTVEQAERTGFFAITRLVLKFSVWHSSGTETEAHSSFELLGNGSLKPFFLVDQLDLNQNSDGRGFLVRIYNKGARVNVAAPPKIGNELFAYWQCYDKARNTEAIYRNRENTFVLDNPMRAVACYGTLGAVYTDEGMREAQFVLHEKAYCYPNRESAVITVEASPGKKGGITIDGITILQPDGNWKAEARVAGFDFSIDTAPDWGKQALGEAKTPKAEQRKKLMMAKLGVILKNLPLELLVGRAKLIAGDANSEPVVLVVPRRE
jgi:hypothetical protein